MGNNLIQNEDFLNIFEKLVKEQCQRAETIKESTSFIDYEKLDKIIIGAAPGDGIGPIIMEQALKVLNVLLEEEIRTGKIEIRNIEGLTLENRVAKGETVPEDVLKAIKECHILLKGLAR